jgi:hypothetical protein
MVAEMSSGLDAIKAALDVAKGLNDIGDSVVRNAAIATLTEKILAAQEMQSALLDQVRKLEAEVTRLKDWEADRKRYQLAELAPGIVALAIKEAMRNGEPFHHLCADCAANGRKFYLQPAGQGEFYETYKCNGCGAVLEINKDARPPWFGVEDD